MACSSSSINCLLESFKAPFTAPSAASWPISLDSLSISASLIPSTNPFPLFRAIAAHAGLRGRADRKARGCGRHLYGTAGGTLTDLGSAGARVRLSSLRGGRGLGGPGTATTAASDTNTRRTQCRPATAGSDPPCAIQALEP